MNTMTANVADCALAHVGELQEFDQNGDLIEEISEICSLWVENVGSTKFEHRRSSILFRAPVWPTSSMIVDQFDP